MPSLFDTRRFTASSDLTGPQEVYPVVSGLKYAWAVEGETKFYRKKLNTKLRFRGADYTFFKSIFDDGACNDVTILVELYCGGAWAEEYTGRIVVSDGEWNLDGCEVVFNVLPNDVYECVFRFLKTPVDFLAYGSRVTLKTILGTVSTTTCTYNGAEFGSPTLRMFYKDCWTGGTNEFNIGFTPDATTGWRPITHNQDFDTPSSGQLQLVTTWARETINHPGGTPSGNGWISLGSDNYARPVMYGQITVDTFTNDGVDHYNLETTVADVEISNGRLMKELIEEIVAASGCDVYEVRSDFLDINAPGTAPANYAYDWAAEYAQTMLFFQKSDISKASATNDAIRCTMTMGDLFTALQNSMNVYWTIENDGGNNILRIEHWSYFEGANGIDLTTLDGGVYIAGTNQFSVDGTVPALEKFSTQEAYSDNFIEKQIEYPQGCSDAENIIEYQQALLCLDVGGLLGNSDAGTKGFVLVAASYVDVGEYLIDNTNDEANGAMAWRAMFQALWGHGRYGPEATTTAGAFTVTTVRPRKEQKDISFKYCCDNGEFTAADLIQTGLGWGQVKMAEYDTERSNMKVNLLHV